MKTKPSIKDSLPANTGFNYIVAIRDAKAWSVRPTQDHHPTVQLIRSLLRSRETAPLAR
jgi:hypothetical protein